MTAAGARSSSTCVARTGTSSPPRASRRRCGARTVRLEQSVCRKVTGLPTGLPRRQLQDRSWCSLTWLTNTIPSACTAFTRTHNRCSWWQPNGAAFTTRSADGEHVRMTSRNCTYEALPGIESPYRRSARGVGAIAVPHDAPRSAHWHGSLARKRAPGKSTWRTSIDESGIRNIVCLCLSLDRRTMTESPTCGVRSAPDDMGWPKPRCPDPVTDRHMAHRRQATTSLRTRTPRGQNILTRGGNSSR
jgi:hypothetical protein